MTRRKKKQQPGAPSQLDSRPGPFPTDLLAPPRHDVQEEERIVDLIGAYGRLMEEGSDAVLAETDESESDGECESCGAPGMIREGFGMNPAAQNPILCDSCYSQSGVDPLEAPS